MRMQTFNPGTMLFVAWDDTTSDASWKSKEEIATAGASEIHTIGFFIENKNYTLKLSHSVVVENGSSDYTAIPWGTIRRVEKLRKEC